MGVCVYVCLRVYVHLNGFVGWHYVGMLINVSIHTHNCPFFLHSSISDNKGIIATMCYVYTYIYIHLFEGNTLTTAFGLW